MLINRVHEKGKFQIKGNSIGLPFITIICFLYSPRWLAYNHTLLLYEWGQTVSLDEFCKGKGNIHCQICFMIYSSKLCQSHHRPKTFTEFDLNFTNLSFNYLLYEKDSITKHQTCFLNNLFNCHDLSLTSTKPISQRRVSHSSSYRLLIVCRNILNIMEYKWCRTLN